MATTRKSRRTKAEREYFRNTRRHEQIYARQLRGIARAIEHLVKGTFNPDDPSTLHQIQEMLKQYAETLTPWATSVAKRMVEEIAMRDKKAWHSLSQSLGLELRDQIENAPIGQAYRQLMGEQVHLIKSIPLDAAQRVHDLTINALSGSIRASDLVAQIQETGQVSKSKATLIARTEVARTSSKLVETRARYVGSEGYIWRTVGDADVRKDHRKLNGKFFKWGEPPIAGSNGMRYHAGGGPNCRCYPEPVIPDPD